MSALVCAQDLVKTYGAYRVLDGVTLSAGPGQRRSARTAPVSPRCCGLGLAGAGRDRPVATLSGGERSRLGLAALLLRQPRALLLDEPTNHISLALAEELEQALHRSPGAVVVASHDRWLRRRWQAPQLALPER